MDDFGYGKPPETGWAKMVTELYVHDLAVSHRFWVDIIGFRIAYQRPGERFMYLERPDGAQVMLYQPVAHPGAAPDPVSQPRCMMQLFVDTIDPITEALESHRWPVLRGPEDVWRRWGDRLGGKREIRLSDPDGNLLLIAEDIGERAL